MVLERGVNSPSLDSNELSSFYEWDQEDSEYDPAEHAQVNVGYVPLGSETVQTVEDEEDEEEELNQNHQFVGVNDGTGTNSHSPHCSDDAIQSTSNHSPSVSAADSFLPDALVDQLLQSQLESTDFEPRGAIGDASLYTQSLPDPTQAVLWNNSGATHESIVLTQAKTDEIKNCMANFVLPKTGIPPWALHIPEDVWKKKLLKKVSNTD